MLHDASWLYKRLLPVDPVSALGMQSRGGDVQAQSSDIPISSPASFSVDHGQEVALE